MQNRFSVIVPVYNVEHYLKECVDSVLRQTFQNYELILVDDGSPDGCPEICDAYGRQDNRVKVIHKENGGLSDARNAGLAHATGEYVIFLDSDDYWADVSFLEKADAFLKQNEDKNDVDVVLFQAKKYFNKEKKFIPDNYYDSSVINTADKNNTIRYLLVSETYTMQACTKVIRASCLTDGNIWFTKGLLGEDLDWFLHLIEKARNIYAIDTVNYVYRIREGSITQTIGKKNLLDCVWMLDKWSGKIAQSDIDEEYKPYYYAVLAYAYLVALLNYKRLKPEDRGEIKEKLKPFHYLLKYSANKRIKMTYISYQLVGFEMTSWLLNVYYRLKQ